MRGGSNNRIRLGVDGMGIRGTAIGQGSEVLSLDTDQRGGMGMPGGHPNMLRPGGGEEDPLTPMVRCSSNLRTPTSPHLSASRKRYSLADCPCSRQSLESTGLPT